MSFKQVFKRTELHEVVNIAVLKGIVKIGINMKVALLKTMIIIMTEIRKIFVRNI